MKYVALVFMSLSSIIHILFFKLESIDFMKPQVLEKFQLNSSSAVFVESWAFNQGFYNLFLALGLIYSIFSFYKLKNESALVLANFILVSMLSAGVILYISVPIKIVPALVQAVPALIALVALNIHKSNLGK